MSLNIRKGDLVQVISGKDRGVKGKVIEVYPESDRVIVEGVNRIKKHTKVGQNARGAKTGGIITTEAPIHVSNVMLTTSNGQVTRVGTKVEGGQQLLIALLDGEAVLLTGGECRRNCEFSILGGTVSIYREVLESGVHLTRFKSEEHGGCISKGLDC